MRQVRYSHRMGQNPTGSIRLLGDSEADWLVTHGHAEYTGADPDDEQPVEPVEQPPAARTEQTDTPTSGPTLAELQARAKQLQLPTYGTKAQLADRIEQAEQTTAAIDEDEDQDDEDELDDED
ncbi:hypothetical protein ACVDFE_02160 [Lentzea chajnantorensis]